MNHCDNTAVEALFRERKIKPTPNRVLVARALMGASAPIALTDLEAELDTVDRSAIFRVLNLFRSTDLVHTIDDGSGKTKYELCRGRHTCAPSHLHAHFHCTRCGSTVCLTDVPVPAVKLPEGYVARGFNYVIMGLCPSCAAAEGAISGHDMHH